MLEYFCKLYIIGADHLKKNELESENTKKLTRKQQAYQTKEKLLSISLKLIQENGFDNVKISDICKEAGVSTGAFYHHLNNKAGIVIAAYSKCDDYFFDVVYPSLKERKDTDVVLDYLKAQLQYAITSGVDLCTQIYKAQLTEGTEFFLSSNRTLPSGLILLIKSLQEEGLVTTDTSESDIGNELLLISRGCLYHWCQCNGNYDLIDHSMKILKNYWKTYII